MKHKVKAKVIFQECVEVDGNNKNEAKQAFIELIKRKTVEELFESITFDDIDIRIIIDDETADRYCEYLEDYCANTMYCDNCALKKRGRCISSNVI